VADWFSFSHGIYIDDIAEGGSQAGSNLGFHRYSDAGGWIAEAMRIVRSTGDIYQYKDVRIGGGLYVGGVGVDPIQSVIQAASDIRAGGGLVVGSVTANPTAGYGVMGGGLSIGDIAPPYEARGNLFLDYTGGGSYGFINSVSNLHIYQNQYYDGAWKAIGSGKVGGWQTSMSSNIPFYVQSSQASYTAGQTPTMFPNMQVSNASVLSLYQSGTAAKVVDMYADASWFRINPAGSRHIYTPRGMRMDQGLTVTSSVGVPGAGVVAAQQLLIYEGTTLMGTIDAQDANWFRINQNVVKNIYTPRSLAVAGALTAGTSLFGSAGDILFTGALRPRRNDVTYAGFVYVPLITPVRIHYVWLGSTAGNLYLNTWFPPYTRAIAVRIYARDTASADTGAQYYAVGPSSTNPYAVIVRTHKANSHFENSGVVPATGAFNSYIYYKTQAGSGASLLVEMWVYGYWL